MAGILCTIKCEDSMTHDALVVALNATYWGAYWLPPKIYGPLAFICLELEKEIK